MELRTRLRSGRVAVRRMSRKKKTPGLGIGVVEAEVFVEELPDETLINLG